MYDKINELRSTLEGYKAERGKYVSQYTDTENQIKSFNSNIQNLVLVIQKLNGQIEEIEKVIKLFSTDNPELEGGPGG